MYLSAKTLFAATWLLSPPIYLYRIILSYSTVFKSYMMFHDADIPRFISSFLYRWMTTFSIFRYFFHLSQELLGYKLSCVHVEMATGYIPKQTLTFEFLFLVFLFLSHFFFVGSGEPVQVLPEAKHAHNNPTRKRTMAGCHLASTAFFFFFFYNGRCLCFLPHRCNSSQHRNHQYTHSLSPVTKKTGEASSRTGRDARFREAGRKSLFDSASNPTSGAVVKVSPLVSGTGHRFPLAFGGGSGTAGVSFPQDGGRGGWGHREDGSQHGVAADPSATGVCKSLKASSFCNLPPPQSLPTALTRMWGFTLYGSYRNGESYGLIWMEATE